MFYSEPCKYSIRLIAKLKSLDTKNVLDSNLINKAIYWAKKYHGNQKRKSGEPYYTHPLEVAYMISDHKLKTDVIVASILHDIIEDTEVTVEMIEVLKILTTQSLMTDTNSCQSFVSFDDFS